MKRLVSFVLVLAVLLSCVSASAFTIEYKDILSNPLVRKIKFDARNQSGEYFTPPVEHPRVMLTDKVKKEILELKDTNEKYKRSFEYVKSLAEKPLPELTGLMSTAVKNQVPARAFMYQFGGLSDKEASELAEYTIEYLTTSKTSTPNSGTIAIYKDYGINGLMVGCYVYDWCYDALSESQKVRLAEAIYKMYDFPEMSGVDPYGYNDSYGDVAGSLVGWPLVFNTVAALALYEMYPDIYDAMMPKVLGPMAELAKIYAEAGVLSDGSIAYTREYYSFFVMEMFDAIGYEKMYGEAAPVGYKMLYSRLPYGGLVRQGDDFTQPVVAVGNYIQGAEIYDMGTLGAYFDDPYLTYGRDMVAGDGASLDNLLYYRSAVESKLPDDLPLAFKGDEPRSEITARTSWQFGYDSPAVVAYMNMNNRRTGDHDHGDVGNFQIYYKGPLAMKTGLYTGNDWGKAHWKNYATRSISANCMLIYDPEEVYDHLHRPVANDGGQIMSNHKGRIAYGYTGLVDHFSDENLRSTEEGAYIGPNEITPAFSYLKGDITPSYSAHKLNQYTRSMVFMDMFEKDYPAVMVVFDRVDATKDSYKKTWLLHGAEEPTIEGNITTYAATKEGFNGKLVNKTMYPKETVITKIGGDGKDGMVNGVNYPRPEKSAANEYFTGNWRVEVSPANPAKEDLFLNSMYVTDADGNLPELKQDCVETDKMVGVSVKDRLVMFAKDAKPFAETFEITVPDNGYDKVMCLFTDVEAGNWKIGDTVTASKEGSNALMVTLAPGKYTAVKTDADAAEVSYPEMPKAKNGDFMLRDGNVFQNLPYENKLIDGVPYVAAGAFYEKFMDGATCVASGNTLTVNNGKYELVFTDGNSEYVYKKDGVSAKAQMESPAKMIDGVLYINTVGMGKAIGLSGSFSANTKVLRVLKTEIADSNATKLEGVDETKVLWPVEISASTDDGNGPFNTIDRDLSTRWSSTQGDGEWICFDLGEIQVIDSVLIAFYNGDIRHWKFDLEVSNDGINFTTIHKGLKSGGKTRGVEEFKLPAGTSARYVRYVGHGEEVTGSLYNSLTQVIICK